jgi:hypothetical protein
VIIGVIAAAVGFGGGFVLGHRKGESDDKRERSDLKLLNQSLTEKVSTYEDLLQKESAQRQALNTELTKVVRERELRIAAAKDREELARHRAESAEQELVDVTNKERDVAARKAAEWMNVETVEVNSVQGMLKVHEHPSEYVGKKVIVTRELVRIQGEDFLRDSESNGYLFSWKCGVSESVADDLGNNSRFQDNVINYWADTDRGIWAKEMLKMKRRGDPFYRVSLSFKITTKRIGEAGREREYFVAELYAINTN